MLGATPRPAPGVGPAPSDEANILAAMAAFREALAAGDSARVQAAFTRSAWLLDESERPLHHRPVRQNGCRGWCRPGPPLTHYQLTVLPDSATALAVETYRYGTPVASRRARGQQYTAVSVLSRQGSRWLISSQTLYRESLP
ncbi:nuclear transport factor 2 family protein [Hymenobacter sp. DH14]|uniref:Nuclear transport factor 2 family protein n=1 Tax=Hymenobacter cyanobacteriorum TaxID=2926463 RepID=A0A9X2AIB3_9BACT|nr:nuclear transport factor 2 family protein [Hymenobacter cyanobacteriorum]MCI1189788.1 nuclear transport factor 2 family protein [Hymenobacter cyanobacteriorum]